MAVTRDYNDGLYNAYLKQDSRSHGMAILPSNGLPLSLGAKYHWPLYAEAEQLGCALAVHGGCHDNTGLDQADPFAVTRGLGHAFTVSASFGNILLAGVFDRFPTLRIAFLEAGAPWLLMAMERLEEGYETNIPLDPDQSYLRLEAEEDVADYILRQLKGGRLFVGTEG